MNNRLLRDLEDTAQFLAQCRHILSDLVVGDFSVDLGRGDMFMPQHLRYGFQRYALRSVIVVAKVCRAMCIVGLNDNPACLATCRKDMFRVL